MGQDKSNVPRARSIVALKFSKNTRRTLLRLGIKTQKDLDSIGSDWLLCNGVGDDVAKEVESYLAHRNTDKNNDESPVNEASDSPELVEVQKPEDRNLSLVHERLDDLIDACDLTHEEEGETSQEAIDVIARDLASRKSRDFAIHSANKQNLRLLAVKLAACYAEHLSEENQLSRLMAYPVSTLSLSTRTSNILSFNSIRTIGDLCTFGADGIRAERGAGVGVINNIRDELRKLDQMLVTCFDNSTSRQVTDAEVQDSEVEVNDVVEYPLDSDGVGHLMDMSGLSTRSYNILTRRRITTVERVLSLGMDGILRLPNAGQKTAEEILEQAKAQYEEIMAAEDEASPSNAAESEISEPADDSERESEIMLSRIKNARLDISEIVIVSPWVLEEICKSTEHFSYEIFCARVLESLAWSVLEKNPWGLTQEETAEALFFYDDTILPSDVGLALNGLKADSRASFDGQCWKAEVISLDDELKSTIHNDENLDLFKCKAAGQTLEQIGKAYGVTRERIRQKLTKMMSADILGKSRASRYLSLIRKFELDESDVCVALGATKEEWGAAELVRTMTCKDDGDRLSPTELLVDEHIPKRVRLALEKNIYRDYVHVDGEYLPKKKLDLMLYLLKKHSKQEPITTEELRQRYEELLEELNLQNDAKVKCSERYMDTLRHQRNVLISQGKRMRYYEFDRYDMGELVERLRFEDYKNKEISTRIFCANRTDVLEDYDIANEYELHNILRKYSDDCSDRGVEIPYKIGYRMPIIKVGDTDRERQVLELARELSPISNEDFATAYEEKYGIDRGSFNASFFPTVSKYVVGGIIQMDLDDMYGFEHKRMTELLFGDIYSTTYVEWLYNKEFPNNDGSRFNALSLRNLGFRVYSGCVLRDSYSGQAEYFSSLIMGNDFYNESSLPAGVSNLHAYVVFRDKFIRERKLLPYEGGEYITATGLDSLGIDDALMLDFVSHVAKHCHEQDDSYCTVASLKNSGFRHELFEYEVSNDDFYASILCSEGTPFKALKCGKVKVACAEGVAATVAAFVDAQVREGESIDIDELLDDIKAQFGIELRRDKVVAATNKTDLFFSDITDMVYKNHEVFIREVY